MNASNIQNRSVRTRPRTIFSFIVDEGPRFAYQGWHLARSLVEHCGGEASDIHIHCTPEVDKRTLDRFRNCGYRVHGIARFGDGKYCNKLNQLENLHSVDFDRVVLLDTDMIVVSDIRPYLSDEAILGVPVDIARPPLATLTEIAVAAGMSSLPAICLTASSGEQTYSGNCNGGFYSVPKAQCASLSRAWRSWALWLLDNIEPLTRINLRQHVDQVSFWLAIHCAGLPFAHLPSNVNYCTHIKTKEVHFDRSQEIAVIHYHKQMNVLGQLEQPPGRKPRALAAIERANRQIANGFDNEIFWGFRYRYFLKRGSGVGSRGFSAWYKRWLLRREGAESAESVLDVGCGDLAVLKKLNFRKYVGIDSSEESLGIARRTRPDWEFRLAPSQDAPPAHTVLCFEVLIHQETELAYKAMIRFLAEKTLYTLIVSGFQEETHGIRKNPMLFYYEPLEKSLRDTGRFRNIRKLGTHAGVTILRCDV